MDIFRPLLLLFVLLSLLVSAQSADGQTPTYERGDRVRTPAPIGFSNSQLGMGRPVDGSAFSVVQVVPNERRIESVSEGAYDASLFLQQSQFQLNATADALGLASGEWSDASQNRYALLTVRNISRVDRLQTQGPPPSAANADYYVSAVYYGWSLNVMIRGRSSAFTRGVSAQLQDVLGSSGGSVERIAERNELTTEVKLRGLEPRGGSVPIALSQADIQQNFRIGEPQPILVEYTFLNDVESEPIEWAEPAIGPGRYRISQLHVRLTSNKPDGRSWDPFNAGPHPRVTMYKDGRRLATVGPRTQSTSVTFHPERSIDLYSGTRLTFRVEDRDMSEHDFAGTAYVTFAELSRGTPGSRIPLNVQGSVLNSWIVLEPLETFGGTAGASQQSTVPERAASVYTGLNGLFRIGKPEGWKTDYRAEWMDRGLLHVRAVLHPPSAEKAELGGDVSEGIRVNLYMSPQGRSMDATLDQWASRTFAAMQNANRDFRLTSSSLVKIDRRQGKAYTLEGSSAEVTEPEKLRIVYLASPQYVGSISFISPARLWEEYQPLFDELRRGFQVVKSPTR